VSMPSLAFDDLPEDIGLWPQRCHEALARYQVVGESLEALAAEYGITAQDMARMLMLLAAFIHLEIRDPERLLPFFLPLEE
jgi:hypothetical protein